MSGTENKIDYLLNRLHLMDKEHNSPLPPQGPMINNERAHGPISRPDLFKSRSPGTPGSIKRPDILTFPQKQNKTLETDKKLKEIMKNSGKLKINDITYDTDIKDMEYIEELGHGTCGQVVKMRHKPSGEIIAVKQMRRSLNSEENKRIVMDIEVVIKSYDCEYIVQCLGCFITETEVWICMELMSTCFDKLLKRLQHPIPESVLGKVTVATVKALSYLKDKHGVIHRDVKPSNILLDERGNVKLCDFGISGRLVDSRAKTRNAGCAAYMAPERIDIGNSDYDIRADIWSLGISLIELATGALPYQDCKNDFEVLTRVIVQEPPSLPADEDFSAEFRKFVSSCLIKDYKQRPKYLQLKDEPFIKLYENTDDNIDEWFANAIKQAGTSSRCTPRHTSSPLLIRKTVPSVKSQKQQVAQHSFTNGSSNVSVSTQKNEIPPDQTSKRRSNHVSRMSTFHNSDTNHQRDMLISHQSSPDKQYHQSNTTNTVRSYSPFQSHQNHIQMKNVSNNKERINTRSPLSQRWVDVNAQDESPFTSPLPQRKLGEGQGSGLSSPFMQRKTVSESRWSSPLGSPLPLRNNFQNDEQPPFLESTSPIVLQRFYHQQKQQLQAREAEEAAKCDTGKKRFASYIKLQLSGDKSGRSSRHQSPEPPPRLHRGLSGDQSPLTMRRNYIDNATPGSPGLSRRYVSPTPPIPPPRRLSESSSVPGSPQHLRARFRYTPEPQRRLFQNNDVS